MQGFLVVLGVGLALFLVATLADRRSARRAQQAVGLPPARAVAPALSQPDDEQRRALEIFRAEQPQVALRLADASMATWQAPDCLELADATVLCCPEGIGSQRELLDALLATRAQSRPLVVAVTSIPAEELALLCAAPGLTMPVLVGDEQACRQLAELAGATPIGRGDLQSGLAGRALGRVARLVADDGGCWAQPST